MEEDIGAKGENPQLILPYLIKSIKQLELAKVDFIVLPCNTLHSLLPELRNKSEIEIVDLIEEVSNRIKENYKKVGILCTTKTREEGLYDKHLEDIGIIYPDVDEQKKVSDIIIKIIRKKENNEDREYLSYLIEKMKNKGAEKVILACTDLANLISGEDTLDTTQVLIDSIVERMRGLK